MDEASSGGAPDTTAAGLRAGGRNAGGSVKGSGGSGEVGMGAVTTVGNGSRRDAAGDEGSDAGREAEGEGERVVERDTRLLPTLSYKFGLFV